MPPPSKYYCNNCKFPMRLGFCDKASANSGAGPGKTPSFLNQTTIISARAETAVIFLGPAVKSRFIFRTRALNPKTRSRHPPRSHLRWHTHTHGRHAWLAELGRFASCVPNYRTDCRLIRWRRYIILMVRHEFPSLNHISARWSSDAIPRHGPF